ncbi:hypothetical protein [Streptacidiphilus rugosus]|uniref:hypothetical protein n=1 Tax=Streptacidiphilus rugosus TaxID=405783 RepID=UPI00056CC8CA|nr:hypothetical protein [Streptacidiphilus rugosus]
MSYSYQGPQDSTRLAIEFLNVWMDMDRHAAAEHIVEVLHTDDAPDSNLVIAGLLNLGQLMLLEIGKERGARNRDELLAKSREYLSELALNLPGDH